MKLFIFGAAVLFFPFQIISQNNGFTPFQDYEPAFIDSDSMLKNEAALIRWENGWMLAKDISKKKAAWKKTRKVKPPEFLVRIYDASGARLHEIPLVKNLSINKAGGLAAFTISFGGSPVTSVGVVDLKANTLVFAADLKQKVKGAAGPVQLPMENSWFQPSLSEDGKFLICDGFKGTGERESALISLSTGKIEKFTGLALPVMTENRAFFWENNTSKKNNFIKSRPTSGGSFISTAAFAGIAVGLQAAKKNVYAVTNTCIYSIDAATGRVLTKIHDYSYLGKGFDYMAAEKTYLGIINDKTYLFLAVKRIKAGTYDWKLFGLEVE